MMFTSLKSVKNSRKGFTLIELLVVIAIIGILSSVVLASLSTARAKSRDAKRISDIGQIQLALELFFDAAQSYPSTTPQCGAAVCTTTASLEAAVSALQVANYLPQSPVPPVGTTPNIYLYRGLSSTGTECLTVSTACTNYWLGTPLERSDNTVLTSDSDISAPSAGTYAAAPRAVGVAGGILIGNSATCIAAGSPDYCYDVRP